MRNSRKERVEKGVTLIELAVVMAIVGILALFIAPAIREWLDNFRIRQAAREVASDLQFAKMKAISTGVRYTVVFNQMVEGTTYSYVVFPDYNNNMVLNDVDIGDINGDGKQENETTDILKFASFEQYIILDTSQAGGNGIDIPIVTASNLRTIAFDRSGMPRDNAGRLIDQALPNNQESIFLLNKKNEKHLQVTISPSGRIAINEY